MVKARTLEEFIKLAEDVHKDENGNPKYFYDKVVYANEKKKVKIYCKFHEFYFEQAPSSHLRGKGCLPCGKSKKSKKEIERRKKKFIEKAKRKYGNQYSYKKVNYVDENTLVIIICKLHNVEFEQKPANFLRNPKCRTKPLEAKVKKIAKKSVVKISADSITAKSNKKKFMDKAIEKYGESNFDYSKVEYTNAEDEVTISCKIHDITFSVKPRCHVNNLGGGCEDCRGEEKDRNKKINTVEFIKRSKELYPGKYSYEKTDYKGNNVYVIIKCTEHDEEFSQLPSNHYRYEGCRKCSNSPRYTSEEVVEMSKKTHGETYDYTELEYVDARTDVKIICKIHGEFMQNAYTHIKGYGCKLCTQKTEGVINDHLKKDHKTIPQFKKEWCKNPDTNHYLPYDNCLIDYKIIVELDGRQHFVKVANWGDVENIHKRDILKMKMALSNGYSIIRILQEDIYYNRIDWKRELDDKINYLINSGKVKCIFICKNGEYDEFDRIWCD